MSVPDFVNNEIDRLLKEQITRPSKSPYNSRVLVVPTKDQNEDGTLRHRLAIPDRYPKSKYFSIIHLELGFHQILIKESHIKKQPFLLTTGNLNFSYAIWVNERT